MAKLDQELLARVLQGERPAVTLFVQLSSPIFQRVAARGLYRRGRAQGRDIRQELFDLVQHIYMALWSRDCHDLRAWRPDGGRALDSYLRQFAEFQVSSLLRTQRHHPYSQLPLPDDELTRRAGGDEGAMAQLGDRQLLTRLTERLERELDAEETHLFRVLLLEERDVATVAAELGQRPQAIYKRKSRLVIRLRALRAELLGTAASPEDG